MLDVMIIDDDLYIRDYLRKAIDWDSLGLRLVCEAGDSETARDLFDMYRPRIIITDINIPTVSGLELAKEFTARDSNLHIIVITGYGDFENVRASVALGAVELLPKPIVPEEMHRSLALAVDRFREKQERYRTQQLLHDLVQEHRTTLQIQFLTQLMSREPDTDDVHLEESLKLLDLSFPNAHFSVVRLELHADNMDTLSSVTFPVAFQKLFEDKFLSGGYRVWSFFRTENRMDCLLSWSFDKPRGAVETTLTELREETEFYFRRSFRAGIGSAVTGLRQLHISAEQAEIALKFQDGDAASILHFRNVNTLSAPHRINNEKIMRQLADCIQSFRFDDFAAILGDWFQGSEAKSNKEYRQEFALEFLSNISSACYVLSVYPWQEINYPQTVSKILAHTEPDQLKQILLAVGEQLSNLLFKKRTQSKNQLIHLAKLYIHENISDKDMSVASVSSHIGLSNNYFSQLFHKEEKVSFSSYLNMVRIEEAKLLLRDTSKKIFEISEQTGFSNPKYFNYVFKRIVGVTPLDWRKKIMEEL